MSFQEKVESWRRRTQGNGIRLPLLVGLTALTVVVLIWVGSMLLQAVASDGFALVGEEECQPPSHEEDEAAGAEDPTTVFVYVSGCVVAPGVVELPLGSRVCDAVDAAGGFTEGADREGLNLARIIVDGEQLSVADKASASAVPDVGNVLDEAASSSAPGRININTATVEELDALPGVGISTAEKIVADRKANGPFSSPEELKRVSGIGDKKYAALADEICVG